MATLRPTIKLTHSKTSSFSRVVVPCHVRSQHRLVARALQPPEAPSQQKTEGSTAAAGEPADGTQTAVPAATSQPETVQAKAAALLQALSKHRRLITFAVAVADVAFIWVCVKLGVNFFNHS